MIKEWVQTYNPTTLYETEIALREIMQEITLAGLYRANFFKVAAFYGGTALRIFHGLDRFSEDLDFSLMQKNTEFELEEYIKDIVEEFESLGINVSINKKNKTNTTAIDSAFLKSNTSLNELIFEGTIPQLKLNYKPNIKIKIEVDTNPPLNFDTENQLLLKPFSFYVNCMTLPNLFAGKMHALLFRKWKNRVKGRDWYDLEWYIRKGVKLNLNHFLLRAKESGDWSLDEMNETQFLEILQSKIETINIKNVKEDVASFIPEQNRLDIWSNDYFLKLTKLLKFE